jgi:hypothetical protein
VPSLLMRRRGPAIPIPPPESGTTAETEGLVAIRRCSQTEAMVVKSLLESHAIPTFFRSRIAHSVHPFTVGTQGEIVILVPRRESARAARLLFRLVRPPRG